MQSAKWGPPLWIFLHTLTFNAPDVLSEAEKTRYENFFTTLGDMLPCRYCRESYVYFLRKVPIRAYLKDRKGLTYWLYSIHNLVNYKVMRTSGGGRTAVFPYFHCVVVKYEDMRSGDKRSKDVLQRFADEAVSDYRPITLEFVRQVLRELDEVDWDFSRLTS